MTQNLSFSARDLRLSLDSEPKHDKSSTATSRYSDRVQIQKVMVNGDGSYHNHNQDLYLNAISTLSQLSDGFKIKLIYAILTGNSTSKSYKQYLNEISNIIGDKKIEHSLGIKL